MTDKEVRPCHGSFHSNVEAWPECESGPHNGPYYGEDIGRDVHVGLEYWHPGVVSGVEQTGQPVPDGEYGENIPAVTRRCVECVVTAAHWQSE